tara:strand:+ start:2241 stop:3566 length:1326 start_codon:yes stop_codon:yes gene_type:complete
MIISAAMLLSIICYSKIPQNHYARYYERATKELGERYVQEVDQEKLFQGAMTGMMATLDEHSNYLPPRQFEGLDAILNQEFGGLGIQIEGSEDSTELKIITPVLGSPAIQAGLQAGDVIVKIGKKFTRDMPEDESLNLLRGAEGTSVQLSIRRNNDPNLLEFNITREIVRTSTLRGFQRLEEGQWDYRLPAPNDNYLYLLVTDFGQRTTQEVRQVIEEANETTGYDGIILDLRGNGGGLLLSAVSICDLFIDQAKVVEVQYRDEARNVTYSSDAATTLDATKPMVVLIDRDSASASEITAACLQDHERAVVIGERSYGKGSVQDVVVLDTSGDSHAIKYTVAHYIRPSGRNIHRTKPVEQMLADEDWGVQPNDGYKINFEEPQRIAYLDNKRKRFIIKPAVPEDSPDGNSEITTIEFEDDESGFTDPHLQRAIEYLHSRKI